LIARRSAALSSAATATPKERHRLTARQQQTVQALLEALPGCGTKITLQGKAEEKVSHIP
jgi:hypothetical protein